jgi:hypothetical protein
VALAAIKVTHLMQAAAEPRVIDAAVNPPPPELVHAIVTGTTPHLRALDTATVD